MGVRVCVYLLLYMPKHVCIYIYIYIVIHGQIVWLYHNSSVWLDPYDT